MWHSVTQMFRVQTATFQKISTQLIMLITQKVQTKVLFEVFCDSDTKQTTLFIKKQDARVTSNQQKEAPIQWYKLNPLPERTLVIKF